MSLADAAARGRFGGRLQHKRCRLSSRAVIGSVGAVGAVDIILRYWKEPPLAAVGVLDESAHACTGLLALSALGETFELPAVLAMLAGSTAIDLDHVPGMLGSDLLVLPGATRTRPCTHSLPSLAGLSGAMLLVRGTPRQLTGVAAGGLMLHYFRDITELSRGGVPLLWPLADRVYAIGYRWYVAGLLVLAALGLGRRARRHVPRLIRERR